MSTGTGTELVFEAVAEGDSDVDIITGGGLTEMDD